MPTAFANDTTTRTATSLHADLPENIALAPELSGRAEKVDKDVIAALAADIEAHSQHTPVKCRKNDDGQPVLVFGYNRWAAVKLINDRRRKQGVGEDGLMRIEFSYEKLSDEQSLLAAISENRFRAENTPLDHSHNINLLISKFKYPLDKVAAVYFPAAKKKEDRRASIRWVRDHAALNDLGPEAAEGVLKGEIKLTSAVRLARISPKEQKRLIEHEAVTVKGKKRLKVTTILATGKGKTAERAKATLEAQQKRKKTGASASPKQPTAVKTPPSSVYELAEAMACAIDAWIRNEPTKGKAEKNVLVAHTAYRLLVPRRKVEGGAA